MKPAWSVIFLTTLCGMAQGLMLALVGADVFGGALEPAAAQRFFGGGALLCVALAILGLFASFFHLGRPERFWRSAAMWRTSWLSREVIAVPAFIVSAAWYAWAHHAGQGYATAVGFLCVACALALWVCTAMIYACLRFIREWASPFTLANFALLGCVSGFTAASAWAAWTAPRWVPAYLLAAYVSLGAGLVVRLLMLRRNARLRPGSTLQSALGIRNPKIAQKSMGAMGGTFNTREFFHGRSAAVIRGVRWAFLLLLFPGSALLLAWGQFRASGALLAGALAVQYLGLLAERWFFFAQANHPQNLYYQVIS
ncbi:DmsC/YnfH family molybdoenzyme membrane anchor subunit [Pigmentiphaga sp.]|uniref:dimethyl sulfoxide reductase anchor subunit family protein n=1 Tax=Pigmentiphaga sp. TaxID=1977564 RepID=UPI00128C739C|nr:DmsC/YnfH family molybdoenzyme membrane anchor subunit [Pigmentiphaga sp.]MPS28111.1 DMSO reductase [Alcaligenaceae bacterium SAGV5]MPS50737.1 DMSO reductase [Alcaligenaceae bacterium SAGV3]MPT57075.1 DMSO reductase [Alcaligenaceae bacterium]